MDLDAVKMTAKQIYFLIFIIITLNISSSPYFTDSIDNNTVVVTETNYMDSISPKHTPNSVKYFFILISLLPLLGGLWGINTWFNEYNMAKDSVHWEKVPGKIISKSTTSGLTSTSNNAHVNSENTRAICPKIEYKFKTGDRAYKGTRIDLSNRGCSTNSEDAKKILAKFPDTDEKIDVYYSKKYNASVLIPGAQDTNYLWLLLPSVFFLVGLFFVRLAFR